MLQSEISQEEGGVSKGEGMNMLLKMLKEVGRHVAQAIETHWMRKVFTRGGHFN